MSGATFHLFYCNKNTNMLVFRKNSIHLTNDTRQASCRAVHNLAITNKINDAITCPAQTSK
jgi:hypothetical protein